MRRHAGFSLLEMMVSVSILVTVVGVSLAMLIDAQHMYEGVTDMADMQQNLRASMINMQRDFIQAAEGLPTTGISIRKAARPRPSTGRRRRARPTTSPARRYLRRSRTSLRACGALPLRDSRSMERPPISSP